MSEASHGAAPESVAPQPPRWKGIQSLDLVHQLNERCIELLCNVAVADPRHIALPIVTENREIWARLEPDARDRVARMPFVIVDAKFSDEVWWRRVADSLVNGTGAEAAPNGLPHELRRQLMQEIAMFAWQTARWDRTVAQLSLGMTASVVEVIAALTPKQVREISDRESQVIEVRWSNDPPFWRDLLLAAVAGNDEKMAELRLHAKLLLCGELAHLRL